MQNAKPEYRMQNRTQSKNTESDSEDRIQTKESDSESNAEEEYRIGFRIQNTESDSK